MNAILLMSFCLGNIIGPETFRKQDAPDYRPAKITIIITTAIAAGLVAVLRVVYGWENRRRDRRERGAEEHKANQEFMDLTDRENGEFRVSSRLFRGSFCIIGVYANTSGNSTNTKTYLSFQLAPHIQEYILGLYKHRI